ncbi:MAG TPA: pentapeptide repeat-containing protein [Candidatus Saccharimonadales bacterium]|nr:pentapeptide repeat-containing protein [Candidatus Saccharimonadales bacterium]
MFPKLEVIEADVPGESPVEKPLPAESTLASVVSPVASEEFPAEGHPNSESHEEPSSGGAMGGLSLLDLAETIDQHKQWVESAGESGAKADFSGSNFANADLTGVNLQGAVLNKAIFTGADLSMANLRGASLVQTDLRNANLLGTELHGANLMGATLYGTEGLWVGRLGGTNLFDAILPESIAAFDSAKAIGDSTKVARWFYFLTLAVSAICSLLIVLTTDVRLVVDGSALPIPRIGRVLPMSGFYLGAPILLFAIYLRFHFVLLRLWGSMAALPAVFPDGQTLEKDGPWFLMGLGRRHFKWLRETKTPISAMEGVLAVLLAYWAVPATMFLFWLRYLVRQDLRGTMLHVFLLTASVAAATCLPVVVARILRPGEVRRPKSKNIWRIASSTLRAALVTGCVFFVISIGVIGGLPADTGVAPQHSAASIQRWAAMGFKAMGYRPYADLTEAVLSQPPARGQWTEEGIASVPGAKLNQADLRFARGYRAFLANARLWRADLEGAILSEADLRGANLREAVLRSASLDRAQAGHAILVSVNATGSNFASADLRLADLSYGIFENADLSNAKVGGASLYAVNLRGGKLLRTDFSRADLRDAKLENSTMTLANLLEADLSSAKMARANLTGAQLRGTILLDADLSNADLRGAYLPGAILRGANLDGASLAGADLRNVVGVTSAQICSAHWKSAILDPDLLADVQLHCPAQ